MEICITGALDATDMTHDAFRWFLFYDLVLRTCHGNGGSLHQYIRLSIFQLIFYIHDGSSYMMQMHLTILYTVHKHKEWDKGGLITAHFYPSLP